MRIPSDQIPQADNLIDVLRTAISVSQGATTYQAIATSIGKVERQGRYYRKTAEIVGLITTPAQNSSVVTTLGNEIIRTGATINNPLLIQAVLNVRLFQRLIPFLGSNAQTGVTRNDIIEFITRVSDLAGETMPHRRLSSIVSWLDELQLIERRDDRFFFLASTIIDNIEILDFTSIDEPILPRTNNLSEYKTVSERSERASETITIQRDSTAIDRANDAHRRLVNLVAEKIRSSSHIPRYNQLIDLATRIEESDYIFEMKSITNDNARSQVRRGISQLYEHQYLQNLPNANLVLVVENALPPTSAWMIEYLELSRNINLIWDGDENLYGTERTREQFEFLELLAP